MIYTLANTVNIGKPVNAIYDAYGQRIHGMTLRCNTETGEVVQCRTDEYPRLVLHHNDREIVEKRMIFQKPLRVEFVEA